jgi:hypothetical protein
MVPLVVVGENLNNLLILKFECHFVCRYFCSVERSAEFLNESFTIQLIRKRYAVFHAVFVVALAKTIRTWRKPIHKQLTLGLYDYLVAADNLYFVYFCFECHYMCRLQFFDASHEWMAEIVSTMEEHWVFLVCLHFLWPEDDQHLLPWKVLEVWQLVDGLLVVEVGVLQFLCLHQTRRIIHTARLTRHLNVVNLYALVQILLAVRHLHFSEVKEPDFARFLLKHNCDLLRFIHKRYIANCVVADRQDAELTLVEAEDLF